MLPYISSLVDDVCFVRSMHTDAINHDPAITLMQTGSQQAGRPSLGAWVSYGLGNDNRDLPTFVALVSSTVRTGQPLYSRLWGSGFLPTHYQGVRFRGMEDPVLYLSNPKGMTVDLRKSPCRPWPTRPRHASGRVLGRVRGRRRHRPSALHRSPARVRASPPPGSRAHAGSFCPGRSRARLRRAHRGGFNGAPSSS